MSLEFINMAKKRAEDFTRKRKMSLFSMMLFMLNMINESTQTALNRFTELTQGYEEPAMSQQAFSKARQKLNWEAIKALSDALADLFYTGGHNTWRGYRVMAIDGSKIQLPNYPYLAKTYGTIGRGSTSPTAQASILYDVINGIIVDGYIEPMEVDERTLAIRHLDRLCSMKSHCKDMAILDRGYPSYDLIKAFFDRGLSFVMRLRNKFNTDIDEMPIGIHDYVLRKPDGTDSIKIKVVKLELPSGLVETLLTNLTDCIGLDEFKQLYFLRWSVETEYNVLKHRLDLENFSGRTPLAIFQDFYVMLYLANMVAIAAMEAQETVDYAQEGKENKYEYKININHLVGEFKDKLIMAMLADDPVLRGKRCNRVLSQLTQKLTPIRPERSKPRNKVRDSYFHHNQKSNC